MLEFGVKLSYRKAWIAREKAIELRRGSYEESYGQLVPYFYELRKNNPGSITKICRDGQKFLRAFVALGPCLRAFRKNCIRPVIGIDASHMKSKYKGVCFTATALDGQNQLYQIAVAVGEGENNESWNWFLTNLRDALVDIPPNLVIISDRHHAILRQVPRVFPNSYHAYCAFHIQQNLFARFKTSSCMAFFWVAVKAFRRSLFEHLMEVIKGVNEDIYEWLNAIEKERWSNAFFPTSRYAIVTSNSCESTNSVLKHIKDLPICMFFEEFRLSLQELWWERHENGRKWTTKLTPWAEELMVIAAKESRGTQCHPINIYEAFVRSLEHEDHVNLSTQFCTCGEYGSTGIPCAHAVAAIAYYKHDPYRFVSQYYWIENYRSTYEECIYPVVDKSQWDTPEELLMEKLLPPQPRQLPGRPKKLRILSQGEAKKTVKCGRCKRTGHNRKNCSNVINQGSVERPKSKMKRKATPTTNNKGKRLRKEKTKPTVINFL